MKTTVTFFILLQALNDIVCKNGDNFCDANLEFDNTVHWYWNYYKTPQILKGGIYVFKRNEYWLYTEKSFLIGKPTKIVRDWRAFTDNSAIDAPVDPTAVWTEFTFKTNHRLQHTIIFAKDKYCYKYILDNRKFIDIMNCSRYFQPVNVLLEFDTIAVGVLLNLEAHLPKTPEKTAARYRFLGLDSYFMPTMQPFFAQTEKKTTDDGKIETVGPIHRYLNIFFTSNMTPIACYTELPLSTKEEEKRHCFEYQNVKPQLAPNNITYIKITIFFQNFVESALNALGEVIASHEMSASMYVFNATHHCIFPIKQLFEATTILECKAQSNEKFFNCTQEPISAITQSDKLIYAAIIGTAATFIFASGKYFYLRGFEAGVRGPEYDDEIGFK